jgi:hypothetical protein
LVLDAVSALRTSVNHGCATALDRILHDEAGFPAHEFTP